MQYEFRLSNHETKYKDKNEPAYRVVFIDADNADLAWGMIERMHPGWQNIEMVDNFKESKRLSWNDRQKKSKGIPRSTK